MQINKILFVAALAVLTDNLKAQEKINQEEKKRRELQHVKALRTAIHTRDHETTEKLLNQYNYKASDIKTTYQEYNNTNNPNRILLKQYESYKEWLANQPAEQKRNFAYWRKNINKIVY